MPSETKISFSDGVLAEAPRKYSDDYSRKHLTAGSTFSVTSMDALWEKHPRKLSEAGLRRSSEHSVVLTEDTDSFIIGERVWVGGSKPGQIAYIGETQFAPGDWAGIVLDEPIGKNDGSVAGVRYFQCAERRGVFSRLTRLTRSPLGGARSPHAASPASDAGSVFNSPSTPLSAARRRALSPNGSVRSAISTRMNTSVSGSGLRDTELRLGDRVIVSSSQGSKAGVLRYVGPTDFAQGVWCGVELDDPIGKNDGSVEGKRYFDCMPRFGLFAPASKVSRSPSNRKPGACAIHSNGRMRRSTSRDSLTSLGTSLVSSVRTGAGRPALQVGSLRSVRSAASSPCPLSARSDLTPPPAHHPRRHRSAPPFRNRTLLVRRFEGDRCSVIALPPPTVYYELALAPPGGAGAGAGSAVARRAREEGVPLSERFAETVLRGGGGGAGAVVCARGRPHALTRTTREAGELFVELSPAQYFANFGRSYHYSCVSPFHFTYPNVVYI